jgi:sialate O-acetylesterase
LPGVLIFKLNRIFEHENYFYIILLDHLLLKFNIMNIRFTRSLFLILGTLVAYRLDAQIKLPSLFTDNMVLQQNSEAAIWGWGDPGSKIKVTGSWGKDTASATVSNLAVWKLNLRTPRAGGPYTLSILGNNKVVLNNIMIGEVWICSGQSNMEWNADLKFNNSDEEISNANYPDIRLFQVKKAGSETRQENCIAGWEVCSPQSMHAFSAIGYFFGRNLYQNLHIPIGIINVSWGGTPAEVWIKKELVESDPFLKEYADKLKEYNWWPTRPGVVYNAMIAPLLPFRIAGAIWYQGESNAETPESYRKLFRTLVENWRHDFENDFPFYYVQIAPFSYGQQSRAAWIREAQMQSMDIPKTGMVVVSDLVDNVKDIHPRNKQDVGKRLANWALAETYGITGLVYKSPLYESMKIEKKGIRISFSNTGNGLVTHGGDPACFEIAGTDKVFRPAKAKIEGSTILVSAKEVKVPVAVRFSFTNDAIGNLFSEEGLPVAPFRTDDWSY